jgi:hypothetical protein
MIENIREREGVRDRVWGTAQSWGAWARRLRSGHESVFIDVQLENLSVQR